MDGLLQWMALSLNPLFFPWERRWIQWGDSWLGSQRSLDLNPCSLVKAVSHWTRFFNSLNFLWKIGKSIPVHLHHRIVMTNETICIYKQSLCVVILRILGMKALWLNKIKQKQNQKTFMHLKPEMFFFFFFICVFIYYFKGDFTF